MLEFCECGSLKLGGKCSNKYCPVKGIKRKVWMIHGECFSFKKPIGYGQAEKSALRIADLRLEIQKELEG